MLPPPAPKAQRPAEGEKVPPSSAFLPLLTCSPLGGYFARPPSDGVHHGPQRVWVKARGGSQTRKIKKCIQYTTLHHNMHLIFKQITASSLAPPRRMLSLAEEGATSSEELPDPLSKRPPAAMAKSSSLPLTLTLTLTSGGRSSASAAPGKLESERGMPAQHAPRRS